MPKQNRPVVRDGRIQAPKKRTDRSYLGPDTAVADAAAPEAPAQAAVSEATAISPDPAPAFAAAPAVASPTVAAAAPQPKPVAVPTVGAARALQQQGVQKRRGVDLDALARRDTSYALHELRRIGVLTTMVIATLIVLGVVLR